MAERFDFLPVVILAFDTLVFPDTGPFDFKTFFFAGTVAFFAGLTFLFGTAFFAFFKVPDFETVAFLTGAAFFFLAVTGVVDDFLFLEAPLAAFKASIRNRALFFGSFGLPVFIARRFVLD